MRQPAIIYHPGNFQHLSRAKDRPLMLIEVTIFRRWARNRFAIAPARCTVARLHPALARGTTQMCPLTLVILLPPTSPMATSDGHTNQHTTVRHRAGRVAQYWVGGNRILQHKNHRETPGQPSPFSCCSSMTSGSLSASVRNWWLVMCLVAGDIH